MSLQFYRPFIHSSIHHPFIRKARPPVHYSTNHLLIRPSTPLGPPTRPRSIFSFPHLLAHSFKAVLLHPSSGAVRMVAQYNVSANLTSTSPSCNEPSYHNRGRSNRAMSQMYHGKVPHCIITLCLGKSSVF